MMYGTYLTFSNPHHPSRTILHVARQVWSELVTVLRWCVMSEVRVRPDEVPVARAEKSRVVSNMFDCLIRRSNMTHPLFTGRHCPTPPTSCRPRSRALAPVSTSSTSLLAGSLKRRQLRSGVCGGVGGLMVRYQVRSTALPDKSCTDLSLVLIPLSPSSPTSPRPQN